MQAGRKTLQSSFVTSFERRIETSTRFYMLQEFITFFKQKSDTFEFGRTEGAKIVVWLLRQTPSHFFDLTETVKFIANEFWEATFGKTFTKFQKSTTSKSFVLYAENFSFLNHLSLSIRGLEGDAGFYLSTNHLSLQFNQVTSRRSERISKQSTMQQITTPGQQALQTQLNQELELFIGYIEGLLTGALTTLGIEDTKVNALQQLDGTLQVQIRLK